MKKIWVDKGGMISGIVGMVLALAFMVACIVLCIMMAGNEEALGGMIFSIVAAVAAAVVFVLCLTYFFIPSCYQLVLEEDRLSIQRFGKVHEEHAYDEVYWMKLANGNKKCIKLVTKENKNMTVDLIFYYGDLETFTSHGIAEYPDRYKVSKDYDKLKDKKTIKN